MASETTKPYTPVRADEIVLNDLAKAKGKILDFGCGDGQFTKRIVGLGKKVYGCDIDRELIQKNRKANHGVEYNLNYTNGKSKYKAKFFDYITLMGVLEHVPDEEELLKELNRIMKPGGVLYMYILNKGLLEIFDTGNIKFRFPGLHKFLYKIFYGSKLYEKEFIEKEKIGMRGDLTAEKLWHSHYSLNDIKRLCRQYFTVKKAWRYGLFVPILLAVEFVYVSIFGKTNNYFSKVIIADQKIDAGELSYCMVVKCIKK